MHAATAREALIAELLGEVDTLLTRLERFGPELTAAQKGLVDSSGEILSAIERYRLMIQALSEQAQRSAVNHIVERTNAVCEGSLAAHTQAMTVAARAAFDNETGDLVRGLLRGLERAARQQQRATWQVWASHAAAALLGCATTAVIVLSVVR